jgi:hypothetical protein
MVSAVFALADARKAVMLGSVIAPGHIRNTLPQTSISIGELNGGESERVVSLQNAFERGGVTARISTDSGQIKFPANEHEASRAA